MGEESRSDPFAVRYARWVIRWRIPVILGALAMAFAAASGARHLGFSDDYRVFFGDENPQLEAFEALQDIYTKNDNILFVLEPRDGQVFTPTTLGAVEDLVGEAWRIPFAIRVDAVTNFQHSVAELDDLIVADLVEEAIARSSEELAAARAIALAEPVLVDRIVARDARVTGVNVTLQLPGESPTETAEAVAYARALAAQVEASHPDITVRLTGVVMLNNSFQEAAQGDMQTLIPLMFVGIVVVLGILLRSVTGTVVSVVLIGLATVTAMGIAGWMGIQITPPSASAPTMILTIAVADAVHILVTMLSQMRMGLSKHEALVESLRLNLQPVFLTSLTTVIGFLSMNFSDSPPFGDLGNMTAMGVIAAFVYSVTFLPAAVSILPMRTRVRASAAGAPSLMDRFGDLVVARRRPLLWGSVGLVAVLAAFLPANELNDQFVRYFDESVDFRTSTDFAVEHLTGIYQVEYSLPAGESGGISEPDYLRHLDAFATWFEQQPEVIQVSSIVPVMKRVNMNMHGDDPSFYRLPDHRDLAAQYLLLYEMSLPYGLDLNNQINVDKSATRFTVTLGDLSSRELRSIADRGDAWLRANTPEYMHSEGASPAIMFAHISGRNITSMLLGTALAFVLVSATLVVALRSWKFGLLSLIPNVVPAVMAFGIWGLFVGQINVGLSIVLAMTFGIVVDDSVHFLTKYLRARREKGLGAEDAVRYAFSSVGAALVVTSLVLATGFLILSGSSFAMNAGMGRLTAITIGLALVADFLLLPPLLIKLAERGDAGSESTNTNSKGDRHEDAFATVG